MWDDDIASDGRFGPSDMALEDCCGKVRPLVINHYWLTELLERVRKCPECWGQVVFPTAAEGLCSTASLLGCAIGYKGLEESGCRLSGGAAVKMDDKKDSVCHRVRTFSSAFRALRRQQEPTRGKERGGHISNQTLSSRPVYLGLWYIAMRACWTQKNFNYSMMEFEWYRGGRQRADTERALERALM